VICAEQPGHVRTDLGLSVQVVHGPERMATADVVLILPGEEFRIPPSAEVTTALRTARTAGAIVAANCTGVFLLAATGLLDGLAATTHWQFSDELAASYPEVTVRPAELYIDHGTILTGAGASAGLDLYLYLVRREHGAAVANQIARNLVTPPHREGGQAQYISAPIPVEGDDRRLTSVIGWAREHLHDRISVDDMATRALMSRRTFARRFKSATGTTPHAWLLAQRLNRAEQLLETTDLSVEEIAHRVSYSSGTVFREQFALRRGVGPRHYRQTFARPRTGF
jgi:transcriptional regulator GlxA family with amidase domain